jgi:hypothetical protein
MHAACFGNGVRMLFSYSVRDTTVAIQAEVAQLHMGQVVQRHGSAK